MKETGIIMSGDHPAKIIAEEKTQTRRTYGLEKINENPDLWKATPTGNPRVWAFYHPKMIDGKEIPENIIRVKCPYGGVGDLIWVRETHWQGNSPTYGKHCIVYDSDKKIAWHPGTPFDNPNLERDFIKKPSIHMFRKDSRIERTITGLRPERLHDITASDIEREGVLKELTEIGDVLPIWIALWDSLNAKRGYPFERNNWVWKISW